MSGTALSAQVEHDPITCRKSSMLVKHTIATIACMAALVLAWFAILEFGIPALFEWCGAIENENMREQLLAILSLLFPKQMAWSVLSALAISGIVLAIGISTSCSEKGSCKIGVFATCTLAVAPCLVGLIIQFASLIPAFPDYEIGSNEIVCIAGAIALACLAAAASYKRISKQPNSIAGYILLACIAAAGPLGLSIVLIAYVAVSTALAIIITIMLLPIILPFMLRAITRSI